MQKGWHPSDFSIAFSYDLTMLHLRLSHLALVVVLSLLGGTFILFLLWDYSFWIPAWLAGLFGLAVCLIGLAWCSLVFGDRGERRTSSRMMPSPVEWAVMFALIIVIALVVVTFLTDRNVLWLLLPAWLIPGSAIIFLLFTFGLLFGLYRDGKKIKFKSTKHKLAAFCWLAFLGLTIVLFCRWHYPEILYPFSFDDSSESLQQTEVVATLDTLIPEKKSVIWCASFQIAWNRLRSIANGEPLQIEGAEVIGRRLNQSEVSQDDLAPGMYYAAAGLTRDGIAEEIKEKMARRYPNTTLPEVVDSKGAVAIAYSHLEAQVRFKEPYFENPTGGRLASDFFAFENPEGNPHPVHNFGILGYVQAPKIRSQVEILYAFIPENSIELSEFAVDLSKESSPNQLVVAQIPKKGTLGETLDDLMKKMKQEPSERVSPKLRLQGLANADTLLLPTMHWRILHRFHALEGVDKPIQNAGPLSGTYVGAAFQSIDFKLDRSGASMRSDAAIPTFSAPWSLCFNRPFLLYMKKRGAQHPFFVMWVDNAELLIKK
jgi:hypothetical protein